MLRQRAAGGALRSTKARPLGRAARRAVVRPALSRARQGSPAPVRLFAATGLLTDPADERGQAEARGSASLVPLPPAAPG